MNLKGERILLRAIEKEDIDFLRTMLNDEMMERNVVGWSFPVSKYEQEIWFEKQSTNKSTIRFIIEVDGKSIGLATIHDIDWKNRKAAHGIKLYCDDVRNKGYGTEVVKTIMKYSFEELQLNRLYSTILEYNKASRRLYEKCGWKEEGIIRKSVYKNNNYTNEIMIGILKEEYESLKDRL